MLIVFRTLIARHWILHTLLLAHLISGGKEDAGSGEYFSVVLG